MSSLMGSSLTDRSAIKLKKKKKKFDDQINHLKAKAHWLGAEIYLFHINDQFIYVSDDPPATWSKRVNGIQRVYTEMIKHFPDDFIGCFDENAERDWIRNDIEEFLNDRRQSEGQERRD